MTTSTTRFNLRKIPTIDINSKEIFCKQSRSRYKFISRNNCGNRCKIMSHPTQRSTTAFDDIMYEVGDAGNFQKAFNILFNLMFITIATMGSFNIVNMLAVPEHWCRVPGREFTNNTVEEWRVLTVPWQTNTTDRTAGNCRMYNSTETVQCQYGWEYDRTFYTETIVSQQDWVCDRGIYVTNALTFARIGEILGTFVFGLIGDYFGRKPVFYLSVMVLLIGRLTMIGTVSIYPLFIVSIVIGNLSGLSIFQSLLVLSMEITNEAQRGYINLLQSIGWCAGLCALPMIYWLVGHWIWVVLLTTLPMVPFLFCCNYIIESPRWLAGRGKIKRCIAILKQIARVNKREISDTVLLSLAKEKVEEEQNYGVTSLFSSRQLAKITILITMGWTSCMMIYMILLYNISNWGGNPHMNYFWQGLAELPGYVLGQFMSDYYGRKLTRLLAFIGMALVSVAASVFIYCNAIVYLRTKRLLDYDPNYEWGVIICGIVLKLLTSLCFYAINLHTIEIYPTCLRQTGSSIAYIVSCIFSCSTPYIVYMGTTINPIVPYLFAMFLAIIGSVCGLFLPETLHQQLPATIEEIERFGHDQKLFSIPKQRNNREHSIIPTDEKV